MPEPAAAVPSSATAPAETLAAHPVRTPQLRAVGSAFLQRRPFIVAPFVVLTLTTMHLSGAPARQVRRLGLGFVVMLSFFFWEAWRTRTRPTEPEAFRRTLVVTVLGIAFANAMSGGLGSPLLPMLFAPVGVCFAAFGRGRESRSMFLWLLLCVGLLALLPAGRPYPALPASAHHIIAAGAVLAAALLLAVGVGRLSDAYAGASAALVRAGGEIVESALARTALIEHTTAELSHELRNPLTSVKGLVELVRERPDDPRNAERLAVVRDEVGRVERALTEHLSFTRPLPPLTRAPEDVAQLAYGVAALLEGRAAEARVDLEAGGPPLRLSLDRARFHEALLNITLNALAATPPGGRVRIVWRRTPGAALVEVVDTGPGLAAETATRVGTAYFTTRPGGTGLGVTLARRVAEAHGGTLTLDGAPGAGTRATFTFPSGAHDADAPAR